VDTKKIKSKWRAEKRKEGLVSGSGSIGQRRQQSDDIREQGSSPESSNKDEADENYDGLTPSKRPATVTHRKDNRAEQIPEEQKGDSLRDMTREAYSQSSLHTFKSDPMRRNRVRSGGSQRGGGARVINPPAGGIGQGRGQPNMKLRMGALLEKIKREYS